MAENDRKIRVMIVDDIAEAREQLRKLLSFDPEIEVIATVRSGEDALEVGPEARPDVVLMDINLPGIDGITATGQLLEVCPTAQVLMLSVQSESDYMRRAMLAGARDYLTKPPSADELLDAIHRVARLKPRPQTGMLTPPTHEASRAMPSMPEPQTRGRIITFFSPKGGTGCTTLAVNTALAVKRALGESAKVGVVDTNLQFGDVSIFMKLQPTRTFSDLVPHAEEMDADLLDAVMVPHPSGLKVLAAPAAPEEAELVREGGVDETGGNRRLRAILSFMQERFDYLIVDTAHVVDDVMLALLDLSDLVLLLTRPVIPEIRGARMFVELLQKMSYPMEKVQLIINAVDNKRMGIQPEAIERAMMPAVAHIPLDERMALRAANYGVPFVLKDGRAPISQAVMDLAQTLLAELKQEEREEENAAQESSQRRVGLGRLL
ncbi:MAG: response regulator [Anaerolineae bacterium]